MDTDDTAPCHHAQLTQPMLGVSKIRCDDARFASIVAALII